MKSYARFKKDLTEAVPLAAPLLAPLVPKILGGAAAAVGLGGMIHQATKQGQGGRSQPADYGQGGTAKPRGKSVQRPSGKVPAAELQRRQAIEDRKAEARRRAQEGGTTQRVVEPTPTPTTKPKKEKVDPRLERAADQVLRDLRK